MTHPNDVRTLDWMLAWEAVYQEPPTLEQIRLRRGWATRAAAENFVQRMQREGLLDSKRRVTHAG